MNTAKFPTELEETKLIGTDGFVLVSDGDGQAKKMRPSVTHTEEPQQDGKVYHYTRLLTDEGKFILESEKDTKNGATTRDGLNLCTPDGGYVVTASRDLTNDGNLTLDELHLRTAGGNEVVSAYREKDAETVTRDEVHLRTADGNEVFSAQMDRDAATGNTTYDELYLRTAEGNEVVQAKMDRDAATGNLTSDEVYLNTAEENTVVGCERTFDANGNETDKQTTIYAKSLKSLKVETDNDTFTAEQLACGSGRTNGTVHQITSATQTIDIAGETVSVFEIGAGISNVTLTLQNVPKSNDPNVLLGGRLVFINNSGSDTTINFLAGGLTAAHSSFVVESQKTGVCPFYTLNGDFIG